MSTPHMDIGIPAEARKQIAEDLSELLADTYTLYLKTHGYHWNVKGPMFPTLHALFEVQYNELWMAVDLVAERIRSLGFAAPAGYQAFAKLSNVEEGTETEAMAMVGDLVKGHETVARTLRRIWAQAEEHRDESTLDVYTQRLSIHEKTAWMLRSLLE